MRNAADRKEIKEAEKQSKLVQRQRVEFLVAAMGTVQGRAWFHELLASCHLFADPFSGNALMEAYLKGERNVGLRLFAEILENCPDQYVVMMREANARRISIERAAGAAGAAAGELAGSEDARWDPEGPIGADTEGAGAAEGTGDIFLQVP